MNKKLPILGAVMVGALCLSGCQTVEEKKSAKPLPAVSAEFPWGGPGNVRKTKRIRNGTTIERVSTVNTDGSSRTIERSDGCSTVARTDDIYGPAFSWNNCRSGPWGTGSAKVKSKEGQLWPLKIGNKVKYKFEPTNSAGKTNPNAYRNCEVTGTANVMAGGKAYDAYKTVCNESSGKRTLYFAPSVNTTVLGIREHNKGWTRRSEYLSEM